jgi:hypothetical protein
VGEDAPASWGQTALGLLPFITAVEPYSFTVGGPEVTLRISGANFAPGAVVRWNGLQISGTVASAVEAAAPAMADGAEAAAALEAERQLVAAGLIPAMTDGLFAVQAAGEISVTLPAALLTTAGLAQLTVENPGALAADPVTLAVNNPAPTISTLSPGAANAGSPAFVLTVTGSGFVNGAKVVWDGQELPTTFVNATRVTVNVAAAQVAPGVPDNVGVLVRNPSAVAADSNTVPFVVYPFTQLRYLPLNAR